MAGPADFNSGEELNDIAVEAQAGPSARSGEEWLDSDEALGATTPLPVILTLSTAVVGLSTQCPTESVNEDCLLLVTTVMACDDDGDDDDDSENPTDVAKVLASEVTGQLLLRDMDVTESALQTVTTNNSETYNIQMCRLVEKSLLKTRNWQILCNFCSSVDVKYPLWSYSWRG